MFVFDGGAPRGVAGGLTRAFPAGLARALLLALVWSMLTAPGGAQPIEQVPSVSPGWRPIFQGVWLTTVRRAEPEPFALYAVRVDLRDPGISFLVTPSNGDRPMDTDSRLTGSFLHEFHCQVAINGSPFLPVVRNEGIPMDVVGLSASRGDRYSEPHPPWSALLLTGDNQASIVPQDGTIPDCYNALGGFDPLLKAGTDVAEAGGPRHPRSAVGVSQDGQYLFLVVIDGRQPGYSVGTTLHETALWMGWLGCWEALNLDGGGSTTLAVEDEVGLPRPLNRSIQEGVPEQQRPSANQLGVFARPLHP